MNGLTTLQRASRGFEARLRLVQPGDWARPTPCTEWDVRALANHVVGGNRRYVMLLHGASAARVNATRAEDHLGDHPVRSFATTAAELASAFQEEGAEARIADHPTGPRTGAELLAMRVVDVAVHTWDLARALGTDDTLDPAALEFALAHVDVINAGRAHGAFGMPTGTISGDGTPQARLLHLAGRTTKEDQT